MQIKRWALYAVTQVLLAGSFIRLPARQFPAPLLGAHAHNDYKHPRPLYDALEAGFTSIEVDVVKRGETLYVGHDWTEISPERTLQILYLDPLYALWRQHHTAILPGWPTLFLMIDIKSEASATYAILCQLLNSYSPMLTRWYPDRCEQGAITVILSGNRPITTITDQPVRLAGLDGRLSDLEQRAKPSLYPWISENWSILFTWRGQGDMPTAERNKLERLVSMAKANGQWLRFWATDTNQPRHRRVMWHVLTEAGVHLINTDDLEGLSAFMRLPKAPALAGAGGNKYTRYGNKLLKERNVR